MRKLLIWLLPMALLLSGCAGKQHFGNHREIDQLVLVQTMGVDRTEDLFIVTISTAAEEGQVLLKTPAVTLSRALKEMQDYTEKKYIFYGHTRHLLLGPSVLAHDLARCLEFVEQDGELRMDTKLYALRDGPAEQAVALPECAQLYSPCRLSVFRCRFSAQAVRPCSRCISVSGWSSAHTPIMSGNTAYSMMRSKQTEMQRHTRRRILHL